MNGRSLPQPKQGNRYGTGPLRTFNVSAGEQFMPVLDLRVSLSFYLQPGRTAAVRLVRAAGARCDNPLEIPFGGSTEQFTPSFYNVIEIHTAIAIQPPA